MFRDGRLSPCSHCFHKSRFLLGFEHLLDFGELGSSFEKSGDTFELLEVKRDSG